MSIPKCLICNKDCNNGEPLLNGGVYHLECYNNLLKLTENINYKILTFESRVEQLKIQQKKENSLVSSLKRFFLGGDSKSDYYSSQVELLQNKIDGLIKKRKIMKIFVLRN